MARDNYLAHHVRHNYTMAELHRLTCIAVKSAGTRAADWRDRYEIAWGAIAEHLYTTWESPSERDLVNVGRAAVLDDLRAYLRHHGLNQQGELREAFLKYWWDSCWVVPSCEDKLVDRLGLVQIMLTMSQSHRDALIALAVWGEHDMAAMALGITEQAFRNRLLRARTAFRSLWHEGETPSRTWHPSERMRWRMDKRREREAVESIVSG